jgi:hypothetical protein
MLRSLVIAAAIARVAIAFAVALPAAALTPVSAQNPDSPQDETLRRELPPGATGIGLTPAQKRVIYRGTAGERVIRPVREKSALHVGSIIPDAVVLNEMPVHVKDEVGLLRDYKFAKLPDAQAVLIVDPASRRVMDIVTRDDAKDE